MRAADGMKRRTHHQGWDPLSWDLLDTPTQVGLTKRLIRERNGRVHFSRLAKLIAWTMWISFCLVLVIILWEMFAPGQLIPSSNPELNRSIAMLILASGPLVLLWQLWTRQPREIGILHARRVIFPRAALAGRRSDARLKDFLFHQADWRGEWQERVNIPERKDIFPSYDRMSRSVTLISISLLLVTRAFQPARSLGGIVSDWVPLISIAYIGSIVFAMSKPLRRQVGRAMNLILEGRCPACRYDLAGLPPALTGEGAVLGPAHCPECATDWPMVVPDPYFVRITR
jgi:hypothetical protein